MSWLLFALLAAAFWSASNLFDEHLTKRISKSIPALVAISGLIAVIPASFFWIAGWVHWPGMETFLISIAAGSVGLLLLYPYMRAIFITDANYVAPLWNFSTIAIVVLAWIFLGEHLKTTDYFAIALLFGSSLIASFRRVNGVHRYDAWAWMIFAAMLYAFELLLEKTLYERIGFTNGYGWILTASFFTGLTIVIMHKETCHYLKEHIVGSLLSLNLTNELLSQLGFAAGGIALSLGPASLVKAVTGTTPVFLLLYGLLLTKSGNGHLSTPVDRKTFVRILISVPLAMIGLALI